MPQTYKTTSPYLRTPQRNSYISYLGFMEYRNIQSDDTDDLIRIGAEYHNRPDLLSYYLYETPDLWWTFAVRNPDLINDPIYDLVSGMELMVPTKTRMLNLIQGN